MLLSKDFSVSFHLNQTLIQNLKASPSIDTSPSSFKAFPVGMNLFCVPDSVLSISKAFPLSPARLYAP